MRREPTPCDVTLLELIALVGLAAGVWVTWPLWTGDQGFPQIPWLAAAIDVPVVVDRWLMGLAAVAGTAAVGSRWVERLAGVRVPAQVAFGVAAVSLVLLNQHRLQAWVLHLLSVLLVLWLSPNARGLQLVRWIAISVYLHSAVSRCDRASLELQWDLVAPLLERWGIDTQYVGERARLGWAGVFAAGEFVVAILLAVPRLRSWGRWLSIAMHAGLILLLGPLGLNHHGGVLVWNGVWIAQNWVLFRPVVAVEREPASVARRGRRIRERVAIAFTGVLVLAPLMAPWGCWDNWPSWRLYSGRPETVTFLVRDSQVSNLPASVRAYVGAAAPLSEWRPVSLDAWSFAELHCPVYPQARFRLAVALAVTREFGLGEDVLVEVGSAPDRCTGARETRELMGEAAIDAECRQYWVNVRPRRCGVVWE